MGLEEAKQGASDVFSNELIDMTTEIDDMSKGKYRPKADESRIELAWRRLETTLCESNELVN
jgi:hypothetical protein